MKYLIFLFVLSMQTVFGNLTTQTLLECMERQDSLVCVGLDPDLSKFPDEILSLQICNEEKAFLFLKEIVDLTHAHVCCYKAQKAFFDLFDHGHALLKDVIAYVKSVDPNLQVFVDCKIGDTENTMLAYKHTLFEKLKADAVVINPYMGDDVFQIFQQDPQLTGIVLIQTSNPSAKVVQQLQLADGSVLWEKMFSLMMERWNQNQNLIPVISSNTTDYDYVALRASIPQQMPILLAGVGAQGGSLSTLKILLNDKGVGVFVNSSRGILYPYDKQDCHWRERVVEETIKLKKAINEIRYS